MDRKRLVQQILGFILILVLLTGCNSTTVVTANFSTAGNSSLSPESVAAGPIHFVTKMDGSRNGSVAIIINGADGSAISADKPGSGDMVWTLSPGTYTVFIVGPDQVSISRRYLTVK